METSSLSHSAYRMLKSLIIRCELLPGEQVSERVLTTQYGLGRAAVRTALSRLSQDGLVRSVARRGYIIAPITMEHVREIFGVRLLLEPPAAAMAARSATPTDLERLDELESHCRNAKYELGNRDDVEQFLQANTNFHVGVVALADNKRLADMIWHLLEEMERLFHIGLDLADRNVEMQHEHHELIMALRAGDAEQAQRVATAQIESSQTMVVNGLISSPALATTNVTPATGA